jgi:hypothetical protein
MTKKSLNFVPQNSSECGIITTDLHRIPHMQEALMALEQRLDSLKKRHAQVDLMIMAEEAHPIPDPILLHQLKRQKLNLKDEMASLLNGQRQAA